MQMNSLKYSTLFVSVTGARDTVRLEKAHSLTACFVQTSGQFSLKFSSHIPPKNET